MTRSPARIPSLDGLRAISISAVLLAHASGTQGFPQWLGPYIETPYFHLGNLGVRVFFVISGFLITGLLLDEHARSGHISLARFYLRRTMRIFPAYIAFVAVIALLAWAHRADVTASDFWHAATYTMNYADHASWDLGHLWSLANEEQFYLLWPAVVLLMTPARAWKIALAVIIIVPFLRLGQTLLFPDHDAILKYGFHATADALAFGCLLALRRDWLIAHLLYRRLVSSLWPALAIIAVGVVVSMIYHFALGVFLGPTLLSAGIALAVDHCVRMPPRLLNARPVAYVGTLSYSLYLWQQPFMHRSAPMATFPGNILFLLVAALGGYYLIERPALRLRPRVEARLLPTRAPTPEVTPAASPTDRYSCPRATTHTPSVIDGARDASCAHCGAELLLDGADQWYAVM